MEHGLNRLISLLLLLLVFASCSMYGGGVQADRQAVSTPAGTVTIHYAVTRIPGAASNQWAIWIENENGGHVKTLYVPNYTARRQGWKARPQMLVTWRKAIDLENMPQENIDALSQATLPAGAQTATWDLTDADGIPVAPGTYVYHVEGSLLWENTVLWSGVIRVGGGASASQARVSYFPDGAAELGRTLISDVSAAYETGR